MTQPLHRTLQLDPDRPSTVDGDRMRTVAQSADRIARLAGILQAQGINPGDRVGIMALNSDLFHESLLAVPWAGGVVVPVNYRWSATEIAFSLEECEVAVLIADDNFLGLLDDIRERYTGLRAVVHSGTKAGDRDVLDLDRALRETEPIEDSRRGGSDPFGIFYTGGTTGTPKGVVLTHENLAVSAYGCIATNEFVTPRGRLRHVAPMFHMADIAAWAGGILVNSTHVFASSFNPIGNLETMSEQQVTDCLLVPTMIQMMVDAPGARDLDVSCVRHIMYGASPMSDAVLARARALFSEATFIQMYGMSELSPVATTLLSADHDDPALRNSVGRAAPHVEVRVVDENDVEVPKGTVGEIVVRGSATMLGYWKRPAETAEALRGGWMHTGDGGYMTENSYVFVVDRIKDMIITGGENVYSIEVENVISKHPAIATCAVIGLPDEKWGERVHAVVVLHPGTNLTIDELMDFCRPSIAGYKVPRGLTIVDALPLSPAGKVLKRDLRATLGGAVAEPKGVPSHA
jgi:acyl-CoA synthetase (AMP-forming)/AMP-acid ligase II